MVQVSAELVLKERERVRTGKHTLFRFQGRRAEKILARHAKKKSSEPGQTARKSTYVFLYGRKA